MLRPWEAETPIHPLNPIHAWERLPEYVAIQTFARRLGRIFASLPPYKVRALEKPLTKAAVRVAMTISALNLEGAGADEVRRHAEANLRLPALASIERLRTELVRLREAGLGSGPDIGAGLELLASVERALRPAVVAG